MQPLRPQSPTARRPARLLAGVLAVAALIAGLLPQAAFAGTTISLFNSFAGNINFVTTGNTLRANDNTVNACSLLSGLQGTAVDAGTSSGTVSGIPAGSTIVAAYLYYAGSSSTVDSAVTFNGTGVTASRTFTDTTIVPFFGGFVDVSSLVAGNGTYSFTGLTVNNQAGGTYCNNQTVLAGWALVVIYSNPSEAYRVVNVYDGFQAFQNSSITLTPANFKVPNPPIAGSKFAVITWEGDNTLSGNETLQFNGTTLTDACNGANNQYNGTINTLICTGNATTDDVFYGVDIDTFSVDGLVSAGQTAATTFYQSGPDAVMLAAQVISITDAPVSDLSISKVHNGTFGYGDNGSYTITVTNNGPTTTSGTTTVTDTLPAGETYVSATGTGWACGAAGQAVTCTSTTAVASGASFGAITLTVAVATSAGTSLANTATVAVDPSDFDNDSTNNSSTDTVSNAGNSLVHPDLSNSTKTAVNPSGGDIVSGGQVEYVITLNESAGVAASGVSVTDTIPATAMSNLTGVSISGSSTTPTNSSSSTALNVSNITVPANGSVTITFTATMKAIANCTSVSNTASISYAGGNPTATTASYDFVVGQSSCAGSGNKVLYVYDNLSLTRVVQTAVGAGVTINGNGGTGTWTMTPVVPAGKSLVLTAGSVTASLIVANFNASTGSTRTVTVELRDNAGTIATSGGISITTTTAAVQNFTITVPATTLNAGDQLIMVVHVASSASNRQLKVYQMNATTGTSTSRITFATSTVINVDSTTVYNAVFPATTQTAIYSPSNTVYVCAVISDPFGSADVTSATITIIDANGNPAVNGTTPVVNQSMTDEGAKNCAGTASTATEAFEYALTLPAAPGAATGIWKATVTGHEGSEGTVTHSGNASFEVNVPTLTIMKTVLMSADPTGDAIKHSIPGATAQYTITVINNGRGSVDSGSMVISDPVPANTVMSLPATPPFTFTDGATSSGLSVTAGSDANITYVNHSNASYTPTCTRPCTDANIGGFTITLNGSMNGKTGASAPSFTITFNVVIQ